MWPQRWLGTLYSLLYTTQGAEEFGIEDVMKLLDSSHKKARVAISKLRELGLLYTHEVGRDRKRRYRVAEPEVLTYIAAERIGNLNKIKQGRYSRLLGTLSSELLHIFKNKLHNVVLYGSAARGRARRDSDLDLLLILDDETSVGRRIERCLKAEKSPKVDQEIEWLHQHGIETHSTFLPLNTSEASSFPPIMLDVIEDGIPLTLPTTKVGGFLEAHT